MSKTKPNKKNSNMKKKNDTKYNADNEIIIGVTTKPKEKVRVEKRKSTRTNEKSKRNKSNKASNKRVSTKNKKSYKNTSKEKQIKKLNAKKVIISIIVALFIGMCGTIYYLTTPVFNIAEIKIYGNEKNSVDTYLSLSGININETNIFGFTNSSIERRIKENPYVDEVIIKRKLPNVVEIYITERKVDYQISYLNSYVYLNNQGYILEVDEEKSNLLIIEGLSSINQDIKPGQRLANEDLIKLDTVLKVTNYLKYNSVESKLTKVDVSDKENYILVFAKEDKIAYIGNSSSITEKMTTVAKILEVEKGKKGKIYANEDLLEKNRIYFSEDKEDNYEKK